MVFPAMGSKKSGLFSPKCDFPEKSPISGYQHRADGLWTAFLLALTPPPVLPDIADFGMMTTPIQTSVSCYTDSFENLEFAAHRKKMKL